ncbi:MAG: pyruvate ferredoxin oxidoreductase [Candidatus Nanohalarchaeota archaeon]|nr:MAG: pyruvate ferredoxin oxidoreductase [Candidatus Nanohaloarchaeota archaeon]
MESKPLTGGEAVAEAIRQINPGVMAAYPITPQTPIIEKFSQFVANGLVDTEFIRVESEHSALSATVGACAAGVRAMTATSSQGLALMWEILGAAAGLRLPIVMPTPNRALSAPINIHCDHSDTMGARDQGWIHIFSETAQEAYEHTLLAIRVSENKKVRIPSMIMQDGFNTTHNMENVVIHDDKKIRNFLGEYEPRYSLLDVNKPMTHGPFALQNYYFEIKKEQEDAILRAKDVYLKIGAELSKITGNSYELFEEYKSKDAEIVFIVLNSTAGTVKATIDDLRKKGNKAGMIKIKLYRPFPCAEIADALKNAKKVIVLDRSLSFGAVPPVCSDIKNALYNSENRPEVISYVFGLGGKNIYEKDIEEAYYSVKNNMYEKHINYIGLGRR